ncbi:multidrug effflux MFS transporter [Nevskia sp.]|uniref:multidrug effflux MFS transporter n=1 Tax=Nevskia sp. TaxID=1929292 RepID=UPI003F729B9C
MNRFRANPRLLAPLLAGMAMLGPFSIDAFFPAFPTMEAEFAVTRVAMQQSLSVYLLSFAAMSLVHGPLSDAYGRRGVILWSMLLFAVACAGCALADSYRMLLAFRAMQGVCAGAGMIVGRAMIRDRHDGADAQRLMSQVSFIFGFAPAVAPIIGGLVLGLAGWRAIFWLLGGFTLALVVASLAALPETHPRERRTRFALRPLLRTYRSVLGDRRFLLLGFAASLNFGALFIYIASAPSVVLDLLKLSETQFAWLFVPVIAGMMLGSATSARMAGRMSPLRTVRVGFSLMAIGTLLNLAGSIGLRPQVPWFVLPVGLIGTGVTLAFPTLTLLMLDRFPAVRGAAASVQATISLGVSALVSGLVAPLVDASPVLLASAAAAMTVTGYLLWTGYRRITPDIGPQVLSAALEPAVAPTPSSAHVQR